MALALYRKYRPRTFAEVIGQEHVTQPLTVALRAGRLHHAYLFSGPRGCGKTSSARILARSLNCEKGPTPDPCGECDSCRNLAPEGAGSIDVIEIDAASHGGVDDARDLRERAFFAPVASRFKVYVIDEAHMVTTAGFNALLKLVEEPPEYVKFVFATTEPEKVLGTIKSRTHHYPFRLIPPGALRPYLEQLAQREGVTVEPAVFPLVVRAGGGSVRDSLSVLDQLVAGAGPEGVTYARAVALLGVTDVALIDEMCDALAAGDGAAAYATINRVMEAGHDPRRFASDLLERLRDLIVLQQVPDAAEKGLLDGAADQLERMSAQALRFGPATLSRSADIVHNGLVEMRGTTAPRLLLELIAARLLLPGAEDSAAALLQRMERMERRLGAASEPAPQGGAAGLAPQAVASEPAPPAAAGTAPTPASATVRAAAVTPSGAGRRAAASDEVDASVAAPGEAVTPVAAPGAAPASAATSTPEAPAVSGPTTLRSRPAVGGRPQPEATAAEPARPQPGPAGVIDAAAVRRVWDEVLASVGRKSKRAAAVVREATVREVQGDTLVLLFRHQVHADMLAGSPDLLLDAVYEVLGGRWQVRCEHGGGDRRGSAPRPPAGSAVPAPPPAAPALAPALAPPARQAAAAAAVPAPDKLAPVTGSVASRTAPAPPTVRAATAPTAAAPAQPGGAGPVAGAASGAVAGAAVGTGAGTAAGQEAVVGPGGDGAVEDWPIPARPGGDPAEESWPVAARPGGGGGAESGGSAAVPAPAGPERPAAARAPGRRGAGTGRKPAPRAGGDASRPAAGGRSRGGRPAPEPGSPAAPAGGAWAEGAPDEPPYDPEYDGPPTGVPAYEGFDPGDEPLDEVIDERAARQTSEQQALALLQETFGAEKIGEQGHR